MKQSWPQTCPCGSSEPYATCCALWHQGAPAPTAEILMRSRYVAYVLGLEDYLLATWHPTTRPAALGLATGQERNTQKWLGLEVKTAPRQPQVIPSLENHLSVSTAAHAVVEFVARYRTAGGRAERLHEISHFSHEQGRWFYVKGEFPELP